MNRLEIARPPLPSTPIMGGCHCGAVRYAITARPKAVNACHCDDCKRLSGATFGVYLHVAKEALDVTSGTFDTFRRTGAAVERSRLIGVRSAARACGTCRKRRLAW